LEAYSSIVPEFIMSIASHDSLSDHGQYTLGQFWCHVAPDPIFYFRNDTRGLHFKI